MKTTPDSAGNGAGGRLTPYPWEQQPDESDAAYRAFEVYRDLGAERTKRQAYRDRYGKPDAKKAGSTFNEWARRFEWDDRVRQFDLHARRAEIGAFLELRLDEHLDALRSDAVRFSDQSLKVARQLGEGLLLQAAKWLRQCRDPKFTATASDIRAIGTLYRDLIEHGMNTKGAAVGVHQLLGLLTGETPLDLGGSLDSAGTQGDPPRLGMPTPPAQA